MAKVILDDLANLENEQSTINTINTNNERIEAAIEKTLSRDGTSPNTMNTSIDMNSNRITNLAAPQNPNDAARLADIVDIPTTDQMAQAIEAANTVQSLYDNFDDRYLGPKASDPTLDNDGNALVTGALYFSTSANAMKVYNGSAWIAITSTSSAASISVTPTGGIASTNVQSALAELDSEKSATGHTHTSADISDFDTAVDARIPSDTSSLPRSYLAGLTLSNNTTDANNDIDIAAGECRDSSHTYDMALAAKLTKRLDASWAVGNNQGGLDTGSKASLSSYHIYLIRKDSDGTIDALFSASASSPTMPSGWSTKRRIGSVVTDGSGSIRAFTQQGDRFLLASYIKDADSTVGTGGSTISLSVPGGLKLDAEILLSTSGSNTAWVTSFDQNSFSPTTTYNGAPGVTAGRSWQIVRTSNARAIRVVGSAASQQYAIYLFGWWDRRGKDD